MKFILSICLALFAFGICAQTPFADVTLAQPDVAPAAATFDPTAIAGYPAMGWWKASDYTTNAGVATLPDSYTNHWDFTNRGAATGFPTGNPTGLGGKPTMTFDGTSDWLACFQTMTSPANFEWVLVWKETTAANNAYILYPQNGDNAAKPNFETGGSGNWQFVNGSTMTANQNDLSGKWYVVNLISATSGNMMTNLVSITTDAGANNSGAIASGFSLGSYWFGSPGGYAPFELAEMIWYQTNLSVAVRSNVFWYCTNKYSMTP